MRVCVCVCVRETTQTKLEVELCTTDIQTQIVIQICGLYNSQETIVLLCVCICNATLAHEMNKSNKAPTITIIPLPRLALPWLVLCCVVLCGTRMHMHIARSERESLFYTIHCCDVCTNIQTSPLQCHAPRRMNKRWYCTNSYHSCYIIQFPLV